MITNFIIVFLLIARLLTTNLILGSAQLLWMRLVVSVHSYDGLNRGFRRFGFFSYPILSTTWHPPPSLHGI